MTEATRNPINAALDFDGQPGFDRMGVDLPANFLEGEPNHVCATIAMLAMQAHAERVQSQPQALVALALYAADVAATLTTRQFRGLERRVLRYMGTVGDVEYHGTRNWSFANFVHERAVERAKREKLI